MQGSAAIKPVILIAGMHRSGTSMVTRLLNLYGVELPGAMIDANAWNESGYWENEGINFLNEQALRILRSAWFDYRRLDVDPLMGPDLARWSNSVLEAVRTLIKAEGQVLAVKDPRLCRLMPWWLQALGEVGVPTRVLMPFRHPLEVVGSLQRRDGLSAQQCLSLWLRHVLTAERDSRGLPRAFSDYDDCLAGWPDEFERLRRQLELEFMVVPPDAERAAREFARPGARHHTRGQSELQSLLGENHLASRTYQLLRRACVVDDADLRAEFDALLQELDTRPDPDRELQRENPACFVSTEHQRAWAAEHERNITSLRRHIRGLESAISALQASWSWRLTAPLRRATDLAASPAARAAQWLKGVRLQSGPASEPVAQLLNGADPHPLVQAELAARHYVPASELPPPANLPARVIAFYLPQFHAIPENDAWWGTGFTEWTKVRPARPQFAGHLQPRVPGELGYYDLRDPAVMQRQVEMARNHGISGFCFYFYWFHGQRLLELPLQQYLADPRLDLPFCLCWANENWTRTWDGEDRHVLIGQAHSAEDDLDFIAHVAQYLRDPRYIRVGGRPLLVIYRPQLLPDPKATAARWRNWCREQGLGEICLAYSRAFGQQSPAELGFDVAIEFPPNNTAPRIINAELGTLPPDYQGTVYDWTSVADQARDYVDPPYPLFRGVNPGWDNTARRGHKGAIFVGATPAAYQEWLRLAIQDTARRIPDTSERLVFVNAWNEWAEGACLEPDQHYGYAWLEATRAALQQAAAAGSTRRIAWVCHDAHPHGAQYLSLHAVRTLHQDLGFQVELILLEGGPLEKDFEPWCRVHRLHGAAADGSEARRIASALVAAGVRAAICNTTVSGLLLATLADAGLRTVALVHELPGVIRNSGLQAAAKSLANRADRVVFPARQVQEGFASIAPVSESKCVLRHQGLYKRNRYRERRPEARALLRQTLGLPEHCQIVLGVGYLDERKGPDLFVEAGLLLCPEFPDLHLVWVGHWEAHMQQQVQERLRGHPHAGRFHFPGRQQDTDCFYAGADAFALSSREDPFPSTMLEALDASLPVVAFAGTGGADSLLTKGCGVLVPGLDPSAFAIALAKLLRDPRQCAMLGAAGAALIRNEGSHRQYLFDLLQLAGEPLRRISVIVPNYNYANYIEQRLQSIYSQTHPILELLVLDDASTDASVTVAEAVLARAPMDARLEVNASNSGSVFRQWLKGIRAARGELVWIAEADDLAEPEFLEQLSACFDNPEVVLAYVQSAQIDAKGTQVAPDYLEYTKFVSESRWNSAYVNAGNTEITEALAVQNTIPNVSAVLFRRSALLDALERCEDLLPRLKVAGDWLLYSELLRLGKVAFVPTALNRHRRHASGVTLDPANNYRHFAEIRFMQQRIAASHALSEASSLKAQAFADHARHQLGIDTQATGRPEATVAYWTEQLGGSV